VPAVAGAVYSPVELIVPGDAFQLTDLFDALPCTVAVNWAVPPVATEVVAGVTETEVTLGADPVVTVTVAEADLVVSATLVAVTVAEPAAAGAVNRPAGVIVPDEAVQVTAVFVAPCTFATKETVPLVETVEVVGEITTDVAPVVPPGDEDVAVAFSATVTGLALALVMSARLPVTVPGVLAANATSKLWLAPGATVAGTARPTVLKPAPVTVTSLILMLVWLLFVALMVCVPVLPTTVATLTLLGVTARGTAGGFEFGAEELTLMQPEDQHDAAISKTEKNTRTPPRLECEKFNVMSFFF
jgi:hypothetical protein